MSITKRVQAVAVALAAPCLLLSACASAPASGGSELAASSASASPTSTGGAAPKGGAISDAQSCKSFSDVLTILQNAHADFNQGRVSKTEYDGWLSLATRVLAIVPISGEGAVSDDIGKLKTIAPPVVTGSGASSPIANLEWTSGVNIADHCKDAGQELQIEGFVGG